MCACFCLWDRCACADAMSVRLRGRRWYVSEEEGGGGIELCVDGCLRPCVRVRAGLLLNKECVLLYPPSPFPPAKLHTDRHNRTPRQRTLTHTLALTHTLTKKITLPPIHSSTGSLTLTQMHTHFAQNTCTFSPRPLRGLVRRPRGLQVCDYGEHPVLQVSCCVCV